MRLRLIGLIGPRRCIRCNLGYDAPRRWSIGGATMRGVNGGRARARRPLSDRNITRTAGTCMYRSAGWLGCGGDCVRGVGGGGSSGLWCAGLSGPGEGATGDVLDWYSELASVYSCTANDDRREAGRERS